MPGHKYPMYCTDLCERRLLKAQSSFHDVAVSWQFPWVVTEPIILENVIYSSLSLLWSPWPQTVHGQINGNIYSIERLLVKMGYLNYRSRHMCSVDKRDVTLKMGMWVNLVVLSECWTGATLLFCFVVLCFTESYNNLGWKRLSKVF